MESVIRILHLEDDPMDAELVQARLSESDFSSNVIHVATRDEYETILEKGGIDIILADYKLPMYDGISALRHANERTPDIPFIFVSGTMGEEAAIDALTRGATDYVLKHNLSRLTPAVKRAMKEARNQRERSQAEQQIRLLNFALNNVRESVFLIDDSGELCFVNEEACRALGYSREELLRLPVTDVDPDFSMADKSGLHRKIKEQGVMNLESRHKTKDGRIFPVEISANYFEYGSKDYHLSLVRDITDRKRAERERASHLDFLSHMDRINRTIQGAGDLERMMSDLLDVMISIFDCDRAWLVYPCDPNASFWQVPMERTKPEYPGASVLGLSVPMDAGIREVHRIQLASDGSVKYGPGGHLLPEEVSKQFGFKSFISIALYPKIGKPWQFGMHQCSYARQWTAQEERLLQEIGNRLEDALTSLLSSRNLQESEERYRLVFENSPVSIWEEDFSEVKKIFDDLRQQGVSDIEAWFEQHPETVQQCAEAAKIMDVNRATLVLHGAETKAQLMAGLVQTFTPESFETFRKELVCLWNGRTEMVENAVVKTLSGESRHVTVYFSVSPGFEKTLSKVLVSLIDITDLKRAEDELRDRERHFRILLDNIPVCITRFDEDARIVYMNRAVEKFFGTPVKKFVGKMLIETDRPASEPINRKLESMIRQVFSEGVANRTETTWQTVAGARVFDILHVPERDEDGKLTGVLGIANDITDRKQAEAEVERLKNYLANIIDSMPLVLAGIDPNGIVTQWNRQAMEMTGVSSPEAVGRSVADLLPDFSPWIAQFQKSVKRHQPASMEKLLVEQKGKRRFYDLLLYPLVAAGIEGSVLCIEDVTEQTRIQEVMVQTEKMMSLGGLAAGMAHEINNPLGIITQAVQNIERRVLTDIPANRKAAQEVEVEMEGMKRYFEKRQIPEFIRSIREASKRASRIISNILQFSRRSDSTLEPVSIPEILDRVLELAANDYDLKKKYDFRSIDIHRDYGEDIPMVPMIAVELEQVLLNLIKNGAQAMMGNPPDRPPRIDLRLCLEERYAVIEVADNGPGIPEEVRNRVFEPFFTTKEPGVGTGLGLSVAYTIITRNHKGLMGVSSGPEQGTCFTVKLPLGEKGRHYKGEEK